MKFEVESPNGQILELEGDHVPTDAELTEIFASVSPSGNTKESVSENIETEQAPAREWDSLDDQIQNFRSDYKDLSPDLQNELRNRFQKREEEQKAREKNLPNSVRKRIKDLPLSERRLETALYEERAKNPFQTAVASAANALSFGLSDVVNKNLGEAIYGEGFGEDYIKERRGQQEANPVSSALGSIAGSIGLRGMIRKAGKAASSGAAEGIKSLYRTDGLKNIAGRNLLESVFIETPRSLINQYSGIEDKQDILGDITDIGINTALGTGVESILGFTGKIYNTYSKNARAMKALGGKDNFKKAIDASKEVDPSEAKSVFTREIFSNMNEENQKKFAKKFLTDEKFRKEVSPLLDAEFMNNSKLIQDEIKKSTTREAVQLNKGIYQDLKKNLQEIDLTEKGFEKQLGKDNIDYKNFRLKSINEAQANMNDKIDDLIVAKNDLKSLGDNFKSSAKSHENLLNNVDSNSFKSLDSPEARFDFYSKNQTAFDELAKKNRNLTSITKELNPETNKMEKVINLKNIDEILDSDDGKMLLNKLKTEQLLNGGVDNNTLASDLSDLKNIIDDSVSLENIASSKQANAAGLKKGINNILEKFSPMQTAVNNVEREIDNLKEVKKAFTNAFDIKGNVNSPESLTKMLYKQVKDPESGLFKEVIDLNQVAAARSGLKAVDQAYAISGDSQARGQLRKFLKDSGLENILKLDDADKIFTKDLTKETELQKTFLNLIKHISPDVDSNNWFNVAKAIVAGSTNAPLATFNNVAQIVKNSTASSSVKKLVSNILTDYSSAKANAILKSMDPLTSKELGKYIKMTFGDLKVIPQQIYREER